MPQFELDSAYRPTADQPAAISSIAEGIEAGERFVTLLGATGTGKTMTMAATIETLQRHREGRSLCIVDMAVPRDVDAAAAAVPGVALFDIDDLGRRVEARLDERRLTIPAAEQIIDSELEKTVTVIGQRDTAGPTIAALVAWAEELRAREVARTFSAGKALDEETRERVEMLTRSMVRKLLHGPVTRLREAGDPATALAIREAFRLDR